MERLLKLQHPLIGIALAETGAKNLRKLGEEMEFCRMWKMAFEGNAFFATEENHDCVTGQYYLGFRKMEREGSPLFS